MVYKELCKTESGHHVYIHVLFYSQPILRHIIRTEGHDAAAAVVYDAAAVVYDAAAGVYDAAAGVYDGAAAHDAQTGTAGYDAAAADIAETSTAGYDAATHVHVLILLRITECWH